MAAMTVLRPQQPEVKGARSTETGEAPGECRGPFTAGCQTGAGA